jgi:hypothetical protein
MKRSSFFWGSIIVLLGAALLLNNMHLIVFNVWAFFWPAVLVILGVWFLVGPTWQKKSMDTIQTTVPMEDTTSAEIEFHHGAGRLEINASARPGELLNGWFTGGVDSEIHRDNGLTRLKLKNVSDMPFEGPWPAGSHGFEWIAGLSPEIPLKLAFKTGASESVLDLSQLKVTNLSVETGASSTEITLPANAGMTTAQVKSGVASVKIHVPAGVGARIHIKSGLSGVNVDSAKFMRDGEDFISTDFASTTNKLDLDVETGVGSVDIN